MRPSTEPKPHFRNPRLGNNRGIALIVAMFAMVLTIAIATEVAYQAHVEYVTAANSLNRLKAHYAAKAGIELSLFRILLYKKAVSQFGDQLQKSVGIGVLDPIWNFPFAWPPTAISALSAASKDEVDTIMAESAFDGQYAVQVQGEGGKIDLNDLGSPHESLANAAKAQLLEIFRRQTEDNDEFEDRYRSFDFEELVNDMADWVDDNDDSRASGGPESMRYEQPQNADVKIPPNAPFKTLEELHRVRGMNDELFNLLRDKITVYGTKGININQAGKEILKSLDPQIKDEVVSEIEKRRSDLRLGGPFRDADDFYGFLEGQGVRTDAMRRQELPLVFDAEYNFRITSVGQAVNARKTITVITYDIDGLTSRYITLLDEQDKKNPPPDGANPPPPPPPPPPPGAPAPPPPPAPAKKVPVGRPTIVFWEES